MPIRPHSATPQCRLSRREFLAASAAVIASSRTARSGSATSQAVSVPGPVAQVRRIGGVPTFVLDGKPLLVPGFETYAPKERYFKQLAEAGASFFMFNTNAAACDYGHSVPTWLDADTWDYSGFEERAAVVLAAKPDALLMPRVNLGTPRWWLERHPEALECFDDGSVLPTGSNPTLPQNRPFPSLASREWRKAIGDALERFIEYLHRSRFGEHVIGYFLSGTHTEEFYHWACNTPRFTGYSAATLAAFRAWLKRRYGDDRALQQAWHRPDVTFDTAVIPTRAERLDPGDGVFRDPARQMNVIDFYLFWNELIPETIDYFAAIARRVTAGRKLIGAFYGYMYEFKGDPEFGHNALGRLLVSSHLDFVAVTANYYDRDFAKGSDYARSPAHSLQLHDKVWYHDNDVVSFRARDIMAASGFSKDAEWSRNLDVQLRSLGYTDTPEKSRWMYRRGLGFALCSGMFQSWFDLHGGYFDDPELLTELKDLGLAAARAAELDRSSCAEILVVADEASCAYAGPRSAMLRETLQATQNEFTRIGAPVDHVLLSDLPRIAAARYKLLIFLNCYHIDDAQRQSIRQQRMHEGRHLVWCGAPGYFDGSRRSPDFMRSLTGIAIEPIGNTAASGPAGTAAGQFRVRDLDAKPLSLPEAAPGFNVCKKQMDGWTSIYASSAGLKAAAWRQLARSAGVHIFNDADDAFYANSSIVTIHARRAGRRTLRFPRACRVTDLVTGEVLGRLELAVDMTLAEGQTAILKWG